MLTIKSASLRKTVFKEIKRLYETEIVPYNITVEGLNTYMIMYFNIVTMLAAIDATGLETQKLLGPEFNKWFYETHDDIIEKFANNEL